MPQQFPAMRAFAAATLFAVTHATAIAATIGPAPAGDTARVSLTVLKEADHPCPRVSSASRMQDGSIRASCSNGEDYRIVSADGRPLAMRCSAARALGVKGC